MIIYFLLIIFLIICFIANDYIVYQSETNFSQMSMPTKGISFIIISVLVLIAGLRYNVGSDFAYYYNSYEGFKLAELNIFNEPGYKIITRISEIIHDDPATPIFISAFITVTLMTVNIIYNSKIYWLSILLYIFLGDWAGCFNGIRQYLAVAILFAGHSYIKEKKFWNWLIIVFISMLFHITAVVGIVFYFYSNIELSIKNLLLSIILVFIGIKFYNHIFTLISFIKQDELILEGEAATYILNSINPLRILVSWVPVIFFMLFMKYYNKEKKELKFYMNMSILNACLMTTAINSAYLGRIGNYTSIYNAIVWPLLLEQVENRSRKILIFFMIICYMRYWLIEMSKEDLAVFMWIFQR